MPPSPPPSVLSERERQVFALLSSGMRVKDIGAALKLQQSTVSTLIGRIKTKLGVRSTGEVVVYALGRHD